MAASTVNNLRRRNIGGGGIIITQIWSAAAAVNFRRSGHTSSGYEKNVEEQVRPTVVPDEVIEASANKYWAPHPYTGVFGPAAAADVATGAAGGGHNNNNKEDQQLQINDDESSEKAWFRPTSLEDLEKPPSHQY